MFRALRVFLLCVLTYGFPPGVRPTVAQTASSAPQATSSNADGTHPAADTTTHTTDITLTGLLQPPSHAPAARGLPAGFRSLSETEQHLLDGLSGRALAWFLNMPTPRTSPASVANFFGALKPSSASLYNDEAHRAEEFGPFVLRALTREQKDSLANLLIQQREVLQEYVKARDELIGKVHEIKNDDNLSRSFDFRVVKLAREIGREEASIALTQAKAFCELRRVLSADQREYLRLVRANPDVINPDAPEMKETKELLGRMNAVDQQWLTLLCVKCTTFITGGLDENSQSLRNEFPGLLASKTPDNAAKASKQTATFLKTLNVAQQRKLYELLKAEASLVKAYFAQRYYMETMLDGVKRSKGASEQKLRQAGSEMAELEARIAMMEARKFAEIAESLSMAQRLFIKQNLDR